MARVQRRKAFCSHSTFLFSFCLLLVLCLANSLLKAQDEPVREYKNHNLHISKGVLVFEDENNAFTVEQVMHSHGFMPYHKNIINFGLSKKAYWLHFTIKNSSEERKLELSIAQPNLDLAQLYTVDSSGKYKMEQSGTSLDFDTRIHKHQDIFLDMQIPPHTQKEFYLKVRSSTQLLLPLMVGTPKSLFDQLIPNDTFFTFLFGIVFSMFFYNLFIYKTIRDSTYIAYVIYILTASLAQGSALGYTFWFLWPHNLWLARNGLVLFSDLGSIAIILFTKKFLQTNVFLPKHTVGFIVVTLPFLASLCLLFAGITQLSFALMEAGALVIAFYLLLVAWLTYQKKYKPAKYFLFSWLSLCLGGAVLTCKDYGVLPVNIFTVNAIQIGFAIEVILFAFAFADTIKTYKKEKELSQAEKLSLLQQHDELLKENNTMLEIKIKERTQQLQLANDNLTATMLHLKEAQTQLISSEKMASLGLLTAGIAHEINNPINFVTSSVKALSFNFNDLLNLITRYQQLAQSPPVKDLPVVEEIKSFEEEILLPDLKSEITELIGSIEEGAARTAEIVKGLRNFSRLDEGDTKLIDIHEGITNTLLLLRSNIPSYIQIGKHFDARRQIECYPGLLNQVFMNLLSNSIHAIKDKPSHGEESIVVSTREVNNMLEIKIQDTGTGMTEEVQQKMFDPFFTTKPVGEGTGMGMPITFKIIEKHKGKICVDSAPGKGTIITLRLPFVIATG